MNPGENVREFYRSQGVNQLRTEILFGLENILRKRSQSSPFYSQTFSFEEINSLLLAKRIPYEDWLIEANRRENVE